MQNAVELLNCARPSLKRCHMDGIICWPKTCADVQAVNSIVYFNNISFRVLNWVLITRWMVPGPFFSLEDTPSMFSENNFIFCLLDHRKIFYVASVHLKWASREEALFLCHVHRHRGFFNFVNFNLNLWTVQQTVFSDFWKCFWAHAVVSCWSEGGIQKWFPFMWRFLKIISVLPQYVSFFWVVAPGAMLLNCKIFLQLFLLNTSYFSSIMLPFSISYVTCVVYIKFKLNFFFSLNLHFIFCLLWIKHGFVDLQIITFWFYLHFTQSWRWKHRMLVNT